MAMAELRKSHDGDARGKRPREADGADPIKGHKVSAGKDGIQFIVVTDEGNRAEREPGTLSRV
jgi:hypothetical protein